MNSAATLARAPLLCVLCVNQAESDFPLFGAERPSVRLCPRCHRKVTSGTLPVGWCSIGQHYGYPQSPCPRHHAKFALSEQSDVPREWP